MTHPSRRRSVKCISWPGLAHPNLNSLSRSLFPQLSERPSLFAMLVPPPRSNLLSFSSPLFPPVSLIFSALLSGDDRRKARVSVVLMMKRRRKVAHYTFDVDSRGKSHRDVTGRARRARKKCARPAEGKKARVRDFRCARFARFRAKERHAAFVSIIILSTPRSLSLSLSRRISFILSPSLPRGGIFCSRDRKRENRCSP